MSAKAVTLSPIKASSVVGRVPAAAGGDVAAAATTTIAAEQL